MLDHAHMNSLYENATEGIILTGATGKIVMVNPAAEKIFGYLESELKGQPVEVLLPDAVREGHNKLREGFYHHPSNRAMGQGRDLFARRKDGKDIPVEVSLSHYQQGDEMFVIAFIVDITLRKEIENNMLKQKAELEQVTAKIKQLNTDLEVKVEERTMILKEALQKLEQSQQELSDALDKERQLNEIKSRFVSMASHEFRTPLTTVLSSASLIAKYKDTGDQEKREKHIQRIKDSVTNLNDILEDFLSLGRLNEGRVDIKKESIVLKEVVEEVMDEMKAFLKRGQQLTLDCKDAYTARTDKKLFRNILINLIGNAIKFSDENKTVSITVQAEADKIHISIADQGIGISRDDQQHLFTSFFRAGNATNIQGTGLGLHIVKRYIELLEGEISVFSELNKGTTVNFSIPSNV